VTIRALTRIQQWGTRQIIALAACLRSRDRLVAQADTDAVSYELSDVEGPLPILFAAWRPLVEYEQVLDELDARLYKLVTLAHD
jgi:hypothetical protein